MFLYFLLVLVVQSYRICRIMNVYLLLHYLPKLLIYLQGIQIFICPALNHDNCDNQ